MAVVVFAYLLFWWGGKLVNVPAHPGFEASILRQPGTGPVVAVLTAAVFFLGVTALVTLVARRHWIYSGVLAASAGLAAWSFRGGPIQYAMIAPDPVQAGPGVFYVLALELALLGVIVAAAWMVVLPRVDGLSLPDNQPRPLIPKPPTEAYGAILGQSVFIGLGIALLVPNAEKKQAIFGVLVSCFIATLLAQHFFHDERVARWYWVGPILVGLFGYIANALGGTDAKLAAETGRLTGTFAALARPVPLDYASSGLVGMLMGYWIGSEHPAPATEQTSKAVGV
jgi:hypothetical protein